jgi:putative endonuclease
MSRIQAQRAGRLAESVAVLWLRATGHRVLARHFSGGRGSGAGEVDIIAARGDAVLFVEVKLRPTLAEAAAAIGGRQRRRIARAAAAFLATRPDLAARTARFDAVLMAPWRLPRHLRDAWRMEA